MDKRELWLTGLSLIGMFMLGLPALAATITVTTTADEVNTNGQCSLREAIINANNDDQSGSTDCAAGSGADTIVLAAGATYTLSKDDDGGGHATDSGADNDDLDITSTITIQGNGATIERSTATGFRIFHVLGTGNLTLQNVTVRDGYAGGGGYNNNWGGGIYNAGRLTLNGSTLSGNYASEHGGGIYNAGTAYLTSVSSTISGNTAAGRGGGIYNDYGIVTLDNSSTILNKSNGHGGGIFNDGTVTLTNSKVADNRAEGGDHRYGGGIYNNGPTATLNINNSELSNNRVRCSGSWWSTCSSRGGGIYNAGAVTLRNSTLSNNESACGDYCDGRGGGIYSTGTVVAISSTISGNSAHHYGGGFYNTENGTATINNSTLSQNSARYNDGGGIYNSSPAYIYITNSTLSGNSANNGGGIYTESITFISHSTFAYNSARSTGGNIRNTRTLRLRGTIVAYSSAGENCSGGVTSSGYNLSSDTTCTLTQPTDQNNTDPQLDLLRNNGGPTETHALQLGSPAIDVIPPANCTDLEGNPVSEDQRGTARPQGSKCDIGAFEREVYTLTVTKSGAGSGTVTSNPPGITCGADCEQSYDPGTRVTLSATPNSGSAFAGWGGDCSTDGSVIMNANKNCIATFNVAQWTLTVNIAGTGSGTVTSNPAGITCPGDCTENYNHATFVTLTATPATGSSFTSWNGCDSTNGNQCTVTMTAAKNVTATFSVNQFTLTIVKAGTGSGTVASSPEGIDCGSDCSEVYPFNTVVTLTATPNAGSTFEGWSGDSDCTDGQVTMNANKICAVTFILQPQRTLTVAGAGTGSGTVAATGITCTITAGSTSGDCAESYAHGTSVTLTATPNSGSTFTGWSGCDSVSGMDCQVTLTAAKLVTAQFTDPSLGCPNVLVEARPTRATFRPTARRPDTRSFSVTVRNNSGGPVTVSDITLRPGTFDGTYTLVRISPTLPQTVLHGRSRTFTVAVRKAANTPVQTVTAPYFDVQMSCGVLPAGARLVPLRVEGLRAQIQAGQVRLEAVGEGIASLGVELFDLSGRWLLTQQGEGRELTVAVDGLANGVYLYVVRVWGFDGREYASAVRKIVILR
jgi:CSLREA domain-containing protein